VACMTNADSPPGSTSENGCFCEAGFYGDGVTSCVACMANADSPPGSTSENDCFCEAGFYGDGVTSCVACMANADSPPGENDCACNAGYAIQVSSATASCEACVAGTYSEGRCFNKDTGVFHWDGICAWLENRGDDGDADVSQECAQVIEYGSGFGYGYDYDYENGMPPDMCCICMEAFEEECTACPAGTYADAPAASACTPCPDGSTSPPGSMSASDCADPDSSDGDGSSLGQRRLLASDRHASNQTASAGRVQEGKRYPTLRQRRLLASNRHASNQSVSAESMKEGHRHQAIQQSPVLASNRHASEARAGVRLHSRMTRHRREATHGRRLLRHQNTEAPVHGLNEECLKCPAGGNCMAGGDAIELQLGNWIVRDGMFVLTSCPLGHQLINTVDEKRAVSTNDTELFAHDAQRCQACEPSTYIIDPLMPCQRCPQGASCPGLIELCRMLDRVGLLEASDICLACGDGVHGAPLFLRAFGCCRWSAIRGSSEW